jgi:hypothetical protein
MEIIPSSMKRVSILGILNLARNSTAGAKRYAINIASTRGMKIPLRVLSTKTTAMVVIISAENFTMLCHDSSLSIMITYHIMIIKSNPKYWLHRNG